MRLSTRVKKIVKLRHAGRYIASMDRVYRAAEIQDWEGVANTVEELHRRGIATDTSHHWLGLAYLHLRRWSEALEQYQRIKNVLPDQGDDARRHVNHAIAHFEIGNREECARLLEDKMTSEWPAVEMGRAKRLLAEIEVEH